MNTKNEDERKTEMKKILMILVIAMLAAVPASAQIPKLMTYQGVLTDDMGVVVSDGSYNMTFRLYDVPSGGSHLWEETIAVNVSKGIFNTTLGHDIPIDEDFSVPLYLAIAIDGGDELTPRRLFTSNAHAFSALAVFGDENIFPSSGYVGIGTTSPEAPLHIYTNISSSVEPSLLIQNVGNQSVIEFKMATVTQARIRKAGGGDLFLGTVTGNGITFSLGNTPTSRMLPDGSFGIDNISPLEKLDVNGAIRIGNTANTNEGTIRWTGSDFEGYDGSLWNSLTTGGGSGLPSGTSGQTLRHDGVDWTATSNLYNSGDNIGIGTASPSYPLHIVEPDGQVGLMVESAAPDWASIYIHASNSGKPMVAYMMNGVLAARNYITSDYNWNLNLSTAATCLRIQPDGWASFGNVAMAESMNLPGALRLGTTTGSNAGSIRYTGTDFEGYVSGSWNSLTSAALPVGTTGQTLRYDGADWVASSNLYNDGTDIGIGTTSPSTNLHVYEDVNAPMGIRIENPNTGSGSGEQISFVDENGTVAGIRLFDDTNVGSYSGAMVIYNNRPSGSILFGTGGLDRMRILNSGNVAITGSSESTVFSMSVSGDASVSLPIDAVSATEILDEPGVASATNGGAVTILDTPTVIIARTIAAPAGGYVLVIATGQGQMTHTAGVSSYINFGVSDIPTSLPANQDVAWGLSAGAASGTYGEPVTCHGLFEVSAGSNTFFFLGNKGTSTGNSSCFDIQFTVLYIPTPYGTVNPTMAGGVNVPDADASVSSISASDISSERAASIEANNARIEEELAEMRRMVEELKREVENSE